MATLFKTEKKPFSSKIHIPEQDIHQNVSMLADQIPHGILDEALQLAANLHSSLEIDTVVQHFVDTVNAKLQCGSVEYFNNSQQFHFATGESSCHQLRYDLTMHEEILGEILLTRAQIFSDQEIDWLEKQLSALLFPLKNALLYAKAIESAHQDPLTGIANRAALEGSLKRDLNIANRHNSPLSLLLLDLDHFKQINDKFGHCTGDKVLCRVTEAVKKCLRSADALFRYGGEEFVVLADKTDEAGALLLAERIRKAVLAIPPDKLDIDQGISVSIGVAQWVRKDTALSLLKRTDKALYAAKEAGRNCIYRA